jgi:hypothetical protein
LDLHLERSRLLGSTDPDARLATLSCGAALHHARVSLAVQGWRANVTRMPDPGDPDHLASLHLSGEAPVDSLTVRRAQTILLRHTDRRPLNGPPVSPEQLDAITMAVEAEGVSLYVLHPEQVLDLTAAANHAQDAEADDTTWQTEMTYWTGGRPPTGAGIPEATMFAILYGGGDQPQDWLRAGEALSAAWLKATEIGLSVLPLSATIEMVATRKAMRVLLASVGYPYLVLRLGTNDQ